LKTNFGLTYEFADTPSLKKWMANREELSGYELTGASGPYPLSSWPQFEAKESAYNPNRPHEKSGEFSAARTPSSAAEIPGNLGAEPQRALGSAESSAGVGFQASAPVPAPAGLEAAASKPPRDSNANILLWSLAGLLFAI